MADLNFLLHQEVIAHIEIDENEFVQVEGKVISIDINDYYFQEKNEPIMVTVSIDPFGELPDSIDYESLVDIPIGNIYKL